MNPDSSRPALVAAIAHVAPNVDPSAIDPDADLVQELDLDSIDFVGIIAWLYEHAEVDIPERDYPDLFTFNRFVEYLDVRSGGG